MRGMRFCPAALVFLIPALAAAQTSAPPQIMADIHQGDFADAQTLAAQNGDPILQKLVTFFRLTTPGGASANDIQQFIAQNPDWPEQNLLRLRAAAASGITSPPAQAASSPFLDEVTALHEAGQDVSAAGIWAHHGAENFAAATPDQQSLFWPAQNLLARALMAAHDPQDAYAVITAVDSGQGSAPLAEQIADRDFLAGFIALRLAGQPAIAAQWFANLARVSPAIITQARAYYWLGRTQSGAAALADYARAAAYPTTFYGQLASLALGESPSQLAARLNALGEAGYGEPDANLFALMELPHAAVLLVQMQDAHDAAIFLDRAGAEALDDKTRVMAAKLAIGLGLPQSAVAIARLAGAAGQMLPIEGWPTPYAPPATQLEPAIAFGIMRQESSFDPAALSGSGAMGLMQLMPATAQLTARKSGLPYGDLFDPADNMALGTAYLAQEIKDFGNCLPLAIAAYNAGPTNVANWLAQNGDPELGHNPGGADMIDWIEEIPFAETRNYVQRVSENITIYRAKLSGRADQPLTPWLTP